MEHWELVRDLDFNAGVVMGMSYWGRSYRCSVYKWKLMYFWVWGSVSLTGFDILGQYMAFGGASNDQKLGINA